MAEPRKPKTKTRLNARKRKLPIGMQALGDAALDEMYLRPAAPRILIEKAKDDGWAFGCPYEPGKDCKNLNRWEALLFQAFGTRSSGVMNHFLSVFTKLVGNGVWDEERKAWMPRQDDFDAILCMVHSLAPENEAQAAYAAQLCALHLSAMKLGETCSHSYADERTRAVMNKTVRAYGDGLERMARLQGKLQPRAVNQTIEVRYYDHRDQRSIHIAGGAGQIGGQPHGADGGALIPRPALPSPQSGGAAVPVPSGEGKAGLPHPWWGAWLWRAFRRAQR